MENSPKTPLHVGFTIEVWIKPSKNPFYVKTVETRKFNGKSD